MSVITLFRGACAALLGLAVFAAPALAHSYKIGSLEIGHPWARQTPPGATTGAGYLTLTNTGPEPDRLVAVSTPGAEKVEIHEGVTENGVARMRQVPAIDIPAHGAVKLAPGGFHLMLIGLKEGLATGMRLPATLTFEKAGTVEVELAVEDMSYGRGESSAHPDHKDGHAH